MEASGHLLLALWFSLSLFSFICKPFGIPAAISPFVPFAYVSGAMSALFLLIIRFVFHILKTLTLCLPNALCQCEIQPRPVGDVGANLSDKIRSLPSTLLAWWGRASSGQ